MTIPLAFLSWLQKRELGLTVLTLITYCDNKMTEATWPKLSECLKGLWTRHHHREPTREREYKTTGHLVYLHKDAQQKRNQNKRILVSKKPEFNKDTEIKKWLSITLFLIVSLNLLSTDSFRKGKLENFHRTGSLTVSSSFWVSSSILLMSSIVRSIHLSIQQKSWRWKFVNILFSCF